MVRNGVAVRMAVEVCLGERYGKLVSRNGSVFEMDGSERRYIDLNGIIVAFNDDARHRLSNEK